MSQGKLRIGINSSVVVSKGLVPTKSSGRAHQGSVWQVDDYPEGNRTKMLQNLRGSIVVGKELPLEKLYASPENFSLAHC